MSGKFTPPASPFGRGDCQFDTKKLEKNKGKRLTPFPTAAKRPLQFSGFGSHTSN
jgi:hypothetical protein